MGLMMGRFTLAALYIILYIEPQTVINTSATSTYINKYTRQANEEWDESELIDESKVVFPRFASPDPTVADYIDAFYKGMQGAQNVVDQAIGQRPQAVIQRPVPVIQRIPLSQRVPVRGVKVLTRIDFPKIHSKPPAAQPQKPAGADPSYFPTLIYWTPAPPPTNPPHRHKKSTTTPPLKITYPTTPPPPFLPVLDIDLPDGYGEVITYVSAEDLESIYGGTGEKKEINKPPPPPPTQPPVQTKPNCTGGGLDDYGNPLEGCQKSKDSKTTESPAEEPPPMNSY